MLCQRLNVILRASILWVFLLLPSWASDPSMETAPLERFQMNLSYASLVKKVAPSVVNIYATRMIRSSPLPPIFSDPIFRQFFGNDLPFRSQQPRVQSSLGSGVLVRPNGVVVTNYHVVKYAEAIKVVLQDGREFEGIVKVRDKRTDLAVIQLKNAPNSLPHLSFRDADSLEVGDIVFAFGNPFGFGHTVTSGIISALARNEVGIADFRSLIQTDASVNPGNSGGPLVTLDGRIVGINTAIFSNNGGSIGIGFAIPANLVLPVLNSLDTGGEVTRAWVGASVETVTFEMAKALGLDKPGGVIIRKVIPDSPAQKADLRSGDVILRIENHDISGESAYRFRLATLSVPSTISIDLLREGKIKTVSLRLEKAPSLSQVKKIEIKNRSPLQGCQITLLTPAVASELNMEGDEGGIVILNIRRGSAAANIGLLPGDVIKRINETETNTYDDLAKSLGRNQGGWMIDYERNGKKQQLIIRNW